MHQVLVAGSNNSNNFAVVEVTDPSNPSVASCTPMFQGGCQVALDGSNAFVGNMGNPGEVQLVDVSNPATPMLLGIIATGLAGIGAIAISGTHVAVGELINTTRARITLLDFSSRQEPVIISTAYTPFYTIPPEDDKGGSPAVTSLAFIGPDKVLASSLSDFIIVQVDFTNADSPAVSTLNPALAGPVSLDANQETQRIIAGDSTSGIIKLFSASPFNHLATANTQLSGVTTVSLSSDGLYALAGASGDFDAALVHFGTNPPAVTRFATGLQGGSNSALDVTTGAFGNTNTGATDETVFDLATTPPRMIGGANTITLLSGVGSLAISSFLRMKIKEIPTKELVTIAPLISELENSG